MPRRESARRNHPLARECDIIETLHMRLTLLQMTFGKHIERKHICFFPGEVSIWFYINYLQLSIYHRNICLICFLFVDIGRSLSHSELRSLDPPAGPRLQGHGRAVWSEHHGHGVLQGEHRALTTWNYIFWKRLPGVHASICHAIQKTLLRNWIRLPDVEPSQRGGILVLRAAAAIQYSCVRNIFVRNTMKIFLFSPSWSWLRGERDDCPGGRAAIQHGAQEEDPQDQGRHEEIQHSARRS